MFKLWRIAVRDLGRNKRRSALTLIAVALGLTLVIVLHAFEMGAIQGAIDDNIRLQTGHIQVRSASYDEEKVSLKWEDLLEEPYETAFRIQDMGEVRSAAPVLWASGILGTVEESVGLRVFGIDPHSEMINPIREGLVAGQFLEPDDRGGVLIAERLASSLGLQVGDDISLLVNTSVGQPDEAVFTIRGLFDTGFPAFDEATLFLPLSKAQTFTRAGERASAVIALLHDRENADTVVSSLQAPAISLLTWRDLNQLLVEGMNSAMGFLYLVYLIVLAIVAVVVANTLLMSVFERTREMGILAALGMKGRQIMTMFILESATLGAIGVILGVLLGSLGVYYLATEGVYFGDLTADAVSADIAYGERMYARFQWADTAVISAVCWIIMIIASLYPAWFATRKEPIDALRTL
jgi:ABC-type lipoprotein release transport system permease subunit